MHRPISSPFCATLDPVVGWSDLYARYLCACHRYVLFFFFNDTATTEIYTLSLHDALPISRSSRRKLPVPRRRPPPPKPNGRSEEHTSELQSHVNLVCRLLLEKKKKNKNTSLPHKTKKTTNTIK